MADWTTLPRQSRERRVRDRHKSASKSPLLVRKEEHRLREVKMRKRRRYKEAWKELGMGGATSPPPDVGVPPKNTDEAPGTPPDWVVLEPAAVMTPKSTWIYEWVRSWFGRSKSCE